MTNAKYFDAGSIPLIRQKLEKAPADSLSTLESIDFQEPTTLLLISIFLGALGVDRFMMGDIGIGMLKLLTAGLCGILTIIDWFTITKRVKQLNLAKISMVL